MAGLAAGIVFANIPAGLLGDIIFKPFFPFFFYLNMVTGSFLFTKQVQETGHIWDWLVTPGLFTFVDFGRVFLTGALVNSILFAVIVYVFMRFVVERYRLKFLRWLISRNRGNRICT